MRKTGLLKKIFLLISTAILLFSNTSEAFAYDSNQLIIKNSSTLEKMSVPELNQYINHIATYYSRSTISLTKTSSKSYSAVQSAWLAAAQIARKKGYPCAASMIECSVKNVPYKENSINATAQCSKKIIKTSAYKSFYKKAKGKKSHSGKIAFTKTMNSDLFYALHNVDIKSTRWGTGNYASYAITVTDTFDFARDNNYNDLFTTIINNWAWLCQQTGCLHKIRVEITFVRS